MAINDFRELIDCNERDALIAGSFQGAASIEPDTDERHSIRVMASAVFFEGGEVDRAL